VYAQRLKPGVDEVPEAMLAAVPGISTVTARALLRRFGTVRAVILAGAEALSTVEGVGPVRARALSRAIS
jgi:ERCC4-type nuclease